MDIKGRLRTRPVCGHAHRLHGRRRTTNLRRDFTQNSTPFTHEGEPTPYGADVAEVPTRQDAWGSIVKRALERWLTANPTKTMEDFCDFTGVSSPTLYRWINGTWKKDPDREKVNGFCDALRIPRTLAERTLQWAATQPARHTEPQADPDVEALGRTLADPEVPEADKQWIRDIVRFATQRRSTRDTPES